ncbi:MULTISPECIES: hypothetical protein [unclassified Bradyrhizobium]|uniref:hypothetical protein n=1 Tax=Bradyrhizobium TaxID=374 RepID=UPI002916E3E3|nr:MULTISPECIES: hypothetical protein [unclassified Bradyrhizobium]
MFDRARPSVPRADQLSLSVRHEFHHHRERCIEALGTERGGALKSDVDVAGLQCSTTEFGERRLLDEPVAAHVIPDARALEKDRKSGILALMSQHADSPKQNAPRLQIPRGSLPYDLIL